MSGANKKKELAQKARLEREAAERAARERSKRLKLLGGAAAAVVVIVLAVVLSGAFKQDATENAGKTSVNVNGKEVTIKGIAETTKLIAGLEQNGIVLGKPDAPATIVEFADMKCPACQQHELENQAEIVDKLVRTGKANLEIQLINIIDPNAGTEDGAVARIAANNMAAKNLFWNFVHTAYYNQGDERDSWATEERLKEIAAGAPGVGVDKLNVRETPESRKLAADADKLSEDLQISGTPSIFVKPRGVREYTPVQSVNSVEAITEAVDAAAKKAKPLAKTR